MRVLHVYSGNLFGGIEAMLLTLAGQRAVCPELDVEVALCFDGRLARELDATGVRVHQLGETRVSRPHTVHRARRALAALIARERFDRVICHAAWPYALFARVVRRAGVPLVFWAHDAFTGKPWTERWARRTAPDLVIANSRYTAATLASVYDKVGVQVAYAPVEAPTPLSSEERHRVREQLGAPAGAVVVVQACRMESWKGHAVLLAALAALQGQPDWTCWLVGGAQRPGEAAYVASLVELTRRLEIADRVRFAGERTDVPRLLASADLLCQPNLTPEPFGIVFVEALGAGLPVVTSELGGAMEIVDESCGRLVPPGDPAALAAALEPLIAGATLRGRLAAAASERARSLCDPKRQVRRLHECLAAMAAAPIEA
jgi:glycosyltransferase involved in cell wall biosynthesis